MSKVIIDIREITFICHSGIRSIQAINLAIGMGYQNEHTYNTYDGGLLQWKKNGESVISGVKKSTLLINRQVQLTAGSMILLFGVLGALPWNRMQTK